MTRAFLVAGKRDCLSTTTVLRLKGYNEESQRVIASCRRISYATADNNKAK